MNMVKQRLKGSVESFSSHIDPNNEGQLKLVKIETESKVKQILLLAKSINRGNKDGVLRKKSQLIKLIEDFHKEYESLYALYDNLRGEIRQKVYIEDEIDGPPTSSSNSDSDMFYSPKDDISEDENRKLEALHIEENVLNDKLTSTSEVVELSKDHEELSKYPEMETEHSGKMVEELLIESSRLKERISELEEELLSVSQKHQLQESERLSQIQELEIQLVGLKQELEKMKKGGELEVSNLKIDLKTLEIERNKLKLHESERLAQIQELEIQHVDLKQELERVKKAGVLEVTNLKKDLKTLRTEKNKLQKQLESEKKKSLQSLNQTENRNLELIKKVAEKKIDDMAEEFSKHSEDKLHTLSQRIEVAEQLQVDLSEWYTTTLETYAQENKDLNNVKEMFSKTNQMFGFLDVVAQRFEVCTVDFMNRISKVSCELKLAKDSIMRKNKATLHVEDYQNCLLAQLDEKEAKLLAYGERVSKSENKARELGILMKESEECMSVLKEEKIEAIRQLCVLTDYHRCRSDYFKKTLTDMSLGCKRSA